ncbi:uncharacterized protein PAC_15051 [Phialocephala subalpina]|uniref:Uncharacterized protein n=1 Tax=Phialocephala subalpina TaxID=576137 RepID=A0A1L7XJD2_9HELO|nr:uncharacterized protein PAC_15051 [Phialocephala subalpina]
MATIDTTLPGLPILNDTVKAEGVDNPVSVAIDSSASDSSHVSDSCESSETEESDGTQTQVLRCCQCKVETAFEGDPGEASCTECPHEECGFCGPRILMDCCHCSQLTEIRGDDCDCSHNFCKNCGRWDADAEDTLPYIGYGEMPDDRPYTMYKKSFYGEPDPDKEYLIENTEANKIAKSRHPKAFLYRFHALMLTMSVPLNDLLQPFSIAAIDDEQKLLKNMEKYLNSRPEILNQIMSLALPPTNPRTIRAIWDHCNNRWSYRSFEEFNTIPAVIWYEKGLYADFATGLFLPAPSLGPLPQYKYFDYKKDTLFLDYARCGNTLAGQYEYPRAIKKALRALVAEHMKEGSPKLKYLKITWCQQEDSPTDFLNILRKITSLEKVTLLSHDHYVDPMKSYDTCDVGASGREERDNDAMKAVVNAGELNFYPFEIKFCDRNGNPVEVDEESEEEDEEDESESEEYPRDPIFD